MADVKEPVDNQFPKKVEEKGNGKAEEKEKHISQKLRVLLIDDNVVCLSILTSQLKHCGFQVTPIIQASEALDLLRRNRNDFDIVMMDVVRFDINGFKLSEIIGREFGIPVIMASAMDEKKAMEEAIRCGARDYLVKPLRVGILQNIWQHVIRTPHCCSPLPPVNTPPADAVSMEANNNKTTTHDGNSAIPNKRSHDDDDDDEKKKKKNKKVEYKYISSSSEESPLIEKKPRVVWDARLHQKFLDAVFRLDVDRAVPKKILEMMNEPGLTRENVASHLQKFRNLIRKERERNMGMNPRDATTHVVNPMIQGAILGNQGLTIEHVNFCGGQEMGTFLQKSLHSGEQLKNMAANSVHQNVAPSSSSSLAIESGIVSAIMRCPPIDRNQRSIFDLDFAQASPQLATTISGLRHPTTGCLVVGNSIDDNLLKLNRIYSNPDIVCNQVEHTESSQAGVSINGENKHHPIMSAAVGTSFGENSGGSTQTSEVADSVGEIKHDHLTQPISDGSNSDRGNNAYFSSCINNVVSHQVRPPQPSQSPGVSNGGIKCFSSDRGDNIIGHVFSYQAQPTQPSQADASIGGIFKHDHLTQHISPGSSEKGNNIARSVSYQHRPTQPSQEIGSFEKIKHDHITQLVSAAGISSDRGNNAHLSSYNNHVAPCQVRSTQYSQVAGVSVGGIKHNHFTQPDDLASGSSNRGNHGYSLSSGNHIRYEVRPTRPSQVAGVSIGGINHDFHSYVAENENGYCMQVLPTTDNSVNVGGNNNVQLSLPSGAATGRVFVQGNNNAQDAEPIHDHSQSVVLTDNTCVGVNINGHQTNSVTEIYSNIESDIDDPPDEEISCMIKELSNYGTTPSIF